MEGVDTTHSVGAGFLQDSFYPSGPQYGSNLRLCQPRVIGGSFAITCKNNAERMHPFCQWYEPINNNPSAYSKYLSCHSCHWGEKRKRNKLLVTARYSSQSLKSYPVAKLSRSKVVTLGNTIKLPSENDDYRWKRFDWKMTLGGHFCLNRDLRDICQDLGLVLRWGLQRKP